MQLSQYLYSQTSSLYLQKPVFGINLKDPSYLSNQDRFSKLYKEMASSIRSLCQQRANRYIKGLNHNGLAQDLEQTVWTDIWEILQREPKLEEKVQNIKGYFWRTAVYRIGEFFRQKDNKHNLCALSLEDNNSANLKKQPGASAILNKISLESALDNLFTTAPGQAIFFKMYYGLEVSDTDIACALNLPLADVQTRGALLEEPGAEKILRMAICQQYSEAQIAHLLQKEESHSLLSSILDLLKDPLNLQVLRLKLGGDYKVAEIAELFNITEGTVKSQLFKARESIQNRL